MLIASGFEYAAPNSFYAQFGDATQQETVPMAVDATQPFWLWDFEINAPLQCTVASGRTPEEILVNIGKPVVIGLEYIFMVWQLSARGANGEWISPQRFVPRP